jgi:hypothetical protein
MSANENPADVPTEAALGLVWGVKKIGEVIDRNERQTYHLIETGQLPVRMIGGRYCSTLGALRRRFAIEEIA